MIPERSIVLDASGITLANDERRQECKRDLALEVSKLQIFSGDRIFVLADNGNGKSALTDAVVAMFSFGPTPGEDLELPNFEGREQRFRIATLFRSPRWTALRQGGEAHDIVALRNREDAEATLFLADDPKLAGDLIDVAVEKHLTLMTGSDPERLETALEHFLGAQSGRILWLEKGRRFYDGTAAEFPLRLEALWEQYTACQTQTGYCGVGKDFIGPVRRAVQSIRCL